MLFRVEAILPIGIEEYLLVSLLSLQFRSIGTLSYPFLKNIEGLAAETAYGIRMSVTFCIE